MKVLAHHENARRAFERDEPGQHFVENAPERVDVGASVDRVAGDLLGRHVLGRAEDREASVRSLPLGRRARVGGERGRDAEVEQLDAALA